MSHAEPIALHHVERRSGRSRLDRLRAMSLKEITYRGRHEAAKWLDRLAPNRWSVESPAQLFERRAPALVARGAALELVRQRLPERFFAGTEPGGAAELLPQHLPNVARDLVRRANAICQRRLDLLGYKGLALDETIDWHRDVVSGVRSAQVHWTQIDTLDRRQTGDSKVTWELNRHQWLVTLAQAYALSDDPRYAREAADLLHDWVRANPYGVGINWTSSLEVSYRLIAWCWAASLLRQSSVCTDADSAQLLALAWVHASHIERYLSSYSSPNTHLTGEALGLFYAGVLFPEFADARRWRDLGRRILVEEADRQILDDGTYFEQATCYHRYTIEIYLHFLLLAERNQIDVPARVRTRVERLVEALARMQRPDGSMPSIGDADGGWVLPLTARDAQDPRGMFAVAAVVFERPDFAWAAAHPAPEVAWLLGRAGVRAFDRLTPCPPASPASCLLPAGGYAVMRGSWDRDAHQLIVDVGPLGGATSGAHGHADLLSVECQAFGVNHILDPGTYCYAAQPAWRAYFRSTAAHSTVVVDGRGQAEPRGPFGWEHLPSARVRDWQSTPAMDLIDAEHGAYADLPDPVVHRRRVLFVKPDYWVIVDDLTGRLEHHIEVVFQCGGRDVRLGPGPWASSCGTGSEGLWIGAFSAAPLAARLQHGELAPIAGWRSPDYGARQPSTTLTFDATVRLPLRVVTLLRPAAPLGATPPRVDARVTNGVITGLTLAESDERIDIDDRVLVVRRPGTSAGPSGLAGRRT